MIGDMEFQDANEKRPGNGEPPKHLAQTRGNATERLTDHDEPAKVVLWQMLVHHSARVAIQPASASHPMN